MKSIKKERTIIFGNGDKELFIQNFIGQRSSSLFCTNVENLKPFHQWILLRMPKDLYRTLYEDKNLLIVCERLCDIPLELRIDSVFYRIENEFEMIKILDKKNKLRNFLTKR